MERKILICDFEDDVKIGDRLLNIFRENPSPPLEVRRTTFAPGRDDDCQRQLSTLLPQFNPKVAFVVLGPDSLEFSSDVFDELARINPTTAIVAVVDPSEPLRIAELLRHRADDFLIAPFVCPANVLPRALRWLPEIPGEDRPPDSKLSRLRQFVGESPAFVEVVEMLPVIAHSQGTVLINGETGTGKEVCARAVHYFSPRADKPFIPVNCGAIPVDLVENELFGHAAGAFTGASHSMSGLVEAAHGGTLFLDEIDALPLMAQVKLLRFLQEKEIRPLGSQKSAKVDVRVIAATNADVQQAVKRGHIRQDFYYRLNVFSLRMPPLRERGSDLIILARHFVQTFAKESNLRCKEFSATALQKLMHYSWPGNVRELENVIERAVALSEGPLLTPKDILLPETEDQDSGSFKALKAKAIADFEQKYISEVLSIYGGNITQAAKAAGKDRRSFWELMRKYNLHQTNPLGQMSGALG